MPAVVKRRGGGVSARTKLVDEDDERGLVFDDDGASHAAEHEETFVSLLWEGGSVSRAGIAVYHRGTADLSVCSVSCPESDLQWLIHVVKQVVPVTVWLTSSSINEMGRREMGLTYVEGDAATLLAGRPTTQGPAPYMENAIPVKVLRAATFAHPAAVQTLSRLTTGEMARRATRAGHAGAAAGSPSTAMQLGGLFDVNDVMLVRATGALVQWLAAGAILTGSGDEERGGGEGASPRPAKRQAPAYAAGLLLLPGTIRTLSLHSVMQVDALSFAALQVFAPTSKGGHVAAGGAAMSAACFAGRGGGREGFSLCGMLDRTCTVPGARLLRAWLRRPSCDPALIVTRQDAVAFLTSARSQSPEGWKDLRKALGKVKDIHRLLTRIRQAQATSGDWWAIEQSLVGAGRVRELLLSLLSGVRVPTALFTQASLAATGGMLGDPLDPSTPPSAQAPALLTSYVALSSPSSSTSALLSLIQQVVDWRATREAKGRVVIQAGVDTTLDEHRRVQAMLPSILGEESEKEAGQYPSLRNPSLQYVPQIGVVLVLSKAENGVASGATPVPGTAASDGGMSHTGMTPRPLRPTFAPLGMGTIPGDVLAGKLYETEEDLVVKTPRCHALDAYFGDLASAVCNMEASILRQLEERVCGSAEDGDLTALGEAVAGVDVLAALAQASGDNKWTRPVIVPEPVLLAKNARHPLQEVALEGGTHAFVPNDIALAPGRPGTGPIAILTGPNGSGKSVYLKLVGLLPILAQIGCFVPADKAIMGPVDRLFTRIASLESAAVAASTFAIDVQQLGNMLRHATPSSLLLIDELGKGTSSVDGVSLLAAAIRALLHKGDEQLHGPGAHPPKSIIATHFSEVFDLGLLGWGEGEGEGEGESALSPTPPGVSFFKMEVLLDRGGATGEGEELPLDVVTPLFKLKPGRADSSYGLSCARMAGLPAPVVARAGEVTAALAAGNAVPALVDSIAWRGIMARATPAVSARNGEAKLARGAAQLLLSLPLPLPSAHVGEEDRVSRTRDTLAARMMTMVKEYAAAGRSAAAVDGPA